MCILALIYQDLPDCPVFLAANRDEDTDRLSFPPEINQDSERRTWFGGRDGVSGGTWMGINEQGILVTLTNRRDRPIPPGPRSRGLLCRELLEATDIAQAESTLSRQLTRYEFAGFNLLAIAADQGFVHEHGVEPARYQVPAGLHILGNAGWNAADDRTQRMRREFEAALNDGPSTEELITHAQRICALGESPHEPAICIARSGYGTVSSSIVRLSETQFESEYFFANGSPRETTWDDLSPALRTMFASSEGA